MKVVSMKCPECGGSIEAQEDRGKTICPYCGTTLFLDDGTIRIEQHVYDEQHVHIYDEARLRELEKSDRADSERQVNLAQWKRIMVVWLAAVGVPLVLSMILSDALPAVSQALSYMSSGLLLFGGVAMYVLYPKQKAGASKNINVSRVASVSAAPYPAKSQTVALALCILLGYFGAHRFYVRKYGTGVLYLFTAGLFFFGWIYDIVKIAGGTFCDADGLPLQ